MTSDGEPDLEPVMGRIRHDAPSWKVDFDSQSSAHTVWADYPGRMRFCGNAGTFEAAWTLASEHNGAVELFIVSVEPDGFNIMKFDRNMVSEGHWFPRRS
jgi:hypothetical protein